MQRIFSFRNDFGVYLCFEDFGAEEDFPSFIRYVSHRLNVPVPQYCEGPYTMDAVLEYAGIALVAKYHADTGCCIILGSKDADRAGELEARLCGSITAEPT